MWLHAARAVCELRDEEHLWNYHYYSTFELKGDIELVNVDAAELCHDPEPFTHTV